MSEYSVPTIPELPKFVVVRRRYWPVATIVLMALCSAVFILEELAGGSTKINVLLEFGASYGPSTRAGEYWRLVMPMFIHIGWLHILLNMYALWVLGPLLERIYGYGRFSVIYVGSGVTSAYVSMMLSSNVAAGASGAIFGIAGAMLVTGYLHREVVPPRWGRAFGKGMVILIVLNLAIGLALPHLIDNWGHVGGLGGGMLLAVLIPPPKLQAVMGWTDEKPFQWMVVAPAAVVALAMVATAQHFQTSRQVIQLLQQGDHLRAQRKDDQAAGVYREAKQRNPNDDRPYEALGSLYLSENRFGDAIREYQQALRLSPGSPDAELGLAASYARQGEAAKAQKILEAVLGGNPKTAKAQAALGDLYLQQKLYPEAIAHYEQALQLNSTLVEVQNNLAWLLATSEDPKYRNPAEALDHAQQAVERSHWKEASFIDTLAEALYVNGQYQEAVEVQKKALALDPANREMQEHMAKYRKAAGA